MSTVTSPEPGKWEITTPKGRKIVVEAPYITETEAKIITALLDTLADKIEELVQQYEIEVTLDPSTMTFNSM
jgi:tetrahydromethanopterin S-methyltransferase subunit B